MSQKIVSLCMALLLLAATTSWTVDKHFCMGHLVDVAFFTDADSCGMNMDDASEEWKMECCTDQIIVITGQDNLKISYNELTLPQQFFVASFALSYLELFQVPEEHLIPNDDYPPPLLVKDLQLLDEVFLI